MDWLLLISFVKNVELQHFMLIIIVIMPDDVLMVGHGRGILISIDKVWAKSALHKMLDEKEHFVEQHFYRQAQSL